MTKEKINIDELKAKYGELKEISCDGFVAYFRKPDLIIWRYALKAVQTSTTAFKVAMARNCFVAGSKELLETPFLEDVMEIINEFAQYETAEIEKDGNAYRVSVLGKSCRLKPATVEIITEADRHNPDDIAFMSRQNMIESMWLDGDAEFKDHKQLDYHMPLLRVVDKLREKHKLTIKNA